MSKKKPKFDCYTNESVQFSAAKGFSLSNLEELHPMTYPQKQFMDSYFSGVPVIIQTGSAGTGKSVLSMWCALYDIISKRNEFRKIVLIRSSVQAREIGYLKGTEEEKNEVYESPYMAICDELLTFKSNNYNNLKAKGLIEFHNTSFLRGKTFDDSIIILDEFENCTYHELSTVMTRVGVNSRVIMCGDLKQTDLHRRNDKSGYGDFMNVIDKMDSEVTDTVVYTPDDIIRSGIVKEFLLAEER